jgi:uncharacterized protein
MSGSILERSRPPVSVSDYTLEEIQRFLADKLRGRVQSAYLFGSVAAGSAGPWSDLDVLLVKETTLPFVERPREFLDLFDLGVPVDILVYTPSEFERLQDAGTGFWRTFREHRLRLV